MERKTALGMVLTVLLTGTLASALNAELVKAEPTIEYVEGFNINEAVDPRPSYDADWFGLEYTPTVSYSIKKVELIAGGGSGNFLIQLRPDDGGMPSNTILRETSFTLVETVSWQGAEFAESHPLTAGTKYWIVFKPVLDSQASIAQSGTLITNVWDYGGDGWDGKDTIFPWMAKFYRETAIPSISAAVDIHPETLNLKSEGRWITAYVELPEGYDAGDIDLSTVKLNNVVSAEPFPPGVGDYDADGVLDRVIKFDRQEVSALLTVGEAKLTITGEVNGTPFEGSDTIRVIGQTKVK